MLDAIFPGWTYPQYSVHKTGCARDMERHWWQTCERAISVRGDSPRPEVVKGDGSEHAQWNIEQMISTGSERRGEVWFSV